VREEAEMKWIPEANAIQVSKAEFAKIVDLSHACQIGKHFDSNKWVIGCAEMGMPVHEMMEHAPVKITVMEEAQ